MKVPGRRPVFTKPFLLSTRCVAKFSWGVSARMRRSLGCRKAHPVSAVRDSEANPWFW
jgi:hypothetical protein